MAARLLLLAVLVCDCSASLLCAGAPRHFVARDTVTRRGATVQMDLSSLVSDHPLAAIAVTAAVSSAAGTALGVFVLPTRPAKIEDETKGTAEVTCPHACVMSHLAYGLRAPVSPPLPPFPSPCACTAPSCHPHLMTLLFTPSPRTLNSPHCFRLSVPASAPAGRETVGQLVGRI